MRRYLPPLFLASLATIAFTSCETTPEQVDEQEHPYGYHGTSSEDTDTHPLPQATPTPSTEVMPQNTAPMEPQMTPVPNPTPMPTPVAQDYPVATPVEGKPGFVKSPYSETGIVDVRGYAPQTEVRDPYSGKVFLVP